MSPTPLIELQRRLAEAGRIRMGEKSDKGAPKRLTTWRITSPTRELVDQAAGLYGGEPKPWESPTGTQYEVVTTTAELPVLVMPGYSFRQGYEFRTSPSLVERRCDGVEMDDGKPCICNAEGDDKCALLTRLTVALPELTTMLGWRLETKGDNAARELLASMDLVQGVAGGRPFVPAKLRIVERRGNVNGQAVRYVVPVIDVSLRYAELLGGEQPREQAQLPTGFTPIAPNGGNGKSLEDGLKEAETQALTRKPRVELPEDDVEDDPMYPVGDNAEEPGAPALTPTPQASTGNTVAASTRDKPATKAQKDKMNVVVGSLRDAGTITTRQVWLKLAKERGVGVDAMIDLLNGYEDGLGLDPDDDDIVERELHWSPLREDMTRGEAHMLIDALEGLEAKVPA